VDRRLTRESSAARRQLLIAGLLGAVDAGLIVAQAVLLATIIARAAQHGVRLGAVRSELVALAAVLAARALLHAAFELSGRIGATRVMSELRRRLIDHLLIDSPGARPGELRTGELVASAVGGVDALETYFAGYLPQLMLAGIVPPVVLAWIAVIDPLLAGLLAATVPLLIGFMILIGKGTQAQTRRRHGALALLSAHFLDVVSGLQTLRSYRREHAQQATLQQVGERYRRETMATLRIAFMSALVLELCAMLGTALAAVTIGLALCAGALSLQAGLVVLLLAPELYGPLREVGQQFHAGADASAAAERIFAALDQTPAVNRHPRSDPGRPLPDPRRQPIRFTNVGFGYGQDGLILDGLDLSLAAGQTTLLTGASGAGKSTLARLLLGFDAPTSGQITCGESDLATMGREQWQANIAWLPQHPTLFAGTIAENLRLGTPDADEASVRQALHAAGAESFIDSLPAGIDTPIGETGRRLSAGQAQRIALARALLQDAAVLILDEPTAHLDARTAADLVPILRRLIADRTVLLIAHDHRLQALADQSAVLAAGRVTSRTSPQWAGEAVGLAA
jgi:thiol reductant ABC exporter CydD subunit